MGDWVSVAGGECGDGSIAVGLLGGLRVSGPGRSLDGRMLGRRGEVVLARLALEAGSAVSRDVLADAVWGASLPASWRGSLRNVMSGLRRALAQAGFDGHVALESFEGRSRLELPVGSTVDVLDLRASVDAAVSLMEAAAHGAARQRAQQALVGAAREVLPGGGEEWVEGLRGEVDALRAQLDLIAGEAALALDEPGRAEAHARALLASSPLREDAFRLLISALWRSGRSAEALEAYDRCRRTLDEALGAQPAEATQALFLRILAQEREQTPVRRPASAAAPVPVALVRLRAATPFVGRVQPLNALLGRARLAGEAGTFVACLSGEPGLGKTRLAAELAARCADEGMGVLYGRAEDRLGVPYGALIEALERPLGGPAAGSLLDRDRVGSAIASSLRSLASDAGMLVVLDDMQWSSRAELEVLEELLADPEGSGPLVLVLHRHEGDPASLAGLGEHPRVWRDQLGPLRLDELTELAGVIAERAGRATSEGRVHEIWRLSGGNPLFASELLESGRSDEAGRMPALVARLVEERLERLPEGALPILRLAAVAGLEFDPAMIAAVASAPAEDVAARLAAARGAALLLDSGEGRLAFRHGLVRDALLDGLQAHERARLHERLGSFIERDASSDRTDLVSLAYHFAAAGPIGNLARSLQYSLPVARQAYEAGVYEDVIVLATRALAAIAEHADESGEERAGHADAALELRILLAGAQRALGDPGAVDTLAEVFAGARRLGDPVRMADAALAIAPKGSVSEASYLDEQQLARYEEALSALDPLGAAQAARRAELLARLAAGYSWSRSLIAGQRFAEQAQALTRGVGDLRTRANVIAILRRSLPGSADVRLMRALEDELADLADSLADPELAVGATLSRFASSVQRGEGEPLEALLQRAGEQARGLRMASIHHAIAYEHASLALLRGRLGEADLLVQRAAAIGRERGLPEVLVEALRLTQMLLVRGEQHRLAEMRVEVEPLFEHAGITAWRASIGVIDAASGHTEGVAERIDAVLDEYESRGPTVQCTEGVIAFLTPTVLSLGDPGRARRVRDHIRPISGQGIYLGGFAGPVDYHLGLLERSLGDEPTAREALQLAAAFSERLGAPLWLARCRQAISPPADP